MPAPFGHAAHAQGVGCVAMCEPHTRGSGRSVASSTKDTLGQDTLTGRILDSKYRLGPLIGKGAIGRVYRATQLSLDREVAIKVLNPGYLDLPEVVARFRQEACAVSRLNHPSIVTVLDWGQDRDGLLYLVIEYMAGSDLFEVAQRDGPMASSRIARLMDQVARGLAHAHARGVVHRDLKPENLRILDDPFAVVGHREFVKIYDFGIAHVARAPLASTLDGALVGTPYYMSPEQATAGPVSPQTDLYACGVIMFLLATGRLPFVADAPLEVANMHVRAHVPRPSRINSSIDPRLEEAILCCMAKNPASRPPSGAELAAMLGPIAGSVVKKQSAWLSGSVGSATKPREHVDSHQTARVHRLANRWPALWAFAATSALLTWTAAQWWCPPGWSKRALGAFYTQSHLSPRSSPDLQLETTGPASSPLKSDSRAAPGEGP
jgi:serine/threonine protein kinase